MRLIVPSLLSPGKHKCSIDVPHTVGGSREAYLPGYTVGRHTYPGIQGGIYQGISQVYNLVYLSGVYNLVYLSGVFLRVYLRCVPKGVPLSGVYHTRDTSQVCTIPGILLWLGG